MTYQQIFISCNQDYKDILMAELAAIGYDSFQETIDGFTTFSEEVIEIEPLDQIVKQYKKQSGLVYTIEAVEKENWNEEWEKSYDPIIIDGKCIVRASFHQPRPGFPIEIVIDPKMSFGTGHHETTYLMLAAQLELSYESKTVLDAGCGTGILSIMADKMGSKSITAYDNDKWVLENIQENFKKNDVTGNILIGTVKSLNFTGNFDIILANINKNILLHDIPEYAKLLSKEGTLLLSGFYEKDLPEIEKMAVRNGLTLVKNNTKNDWMMSQFLAN